jgi:MoaA/NifB/PqqE/SkfB family radical SAM enzyme
MTERLLQFATKLTSAPVFADFAYGAFGRSVMGGWRKAQFAWASIRRVPLERFKRSYFFATKGLQLAVTNVCNARCTFCAYRLAAEDSTRPTGVMPMTVFKKAVDEYSALGGRSIDLTPTVGDPLLDSGLIEKIKYCHEHTGITDICLTTNAIAMCRRDMFKQLVDNGTNTICISLPGLDAKTYKEIYGNDRYPDVIKGIAALLRYNHERGEPSRVILRFRNPDKPSLLIRSKDFQQHIAPYLSSKVSCNFTVDYDNWGGSITEADMSGVMQLRKIPPRYNVPCANLLNFMVHFDGAVRLCGCRLKTTENDGLVVGNIFKNSLVEIGQSEAVHKIIDGFYHGVRPSTCENCSFYNPLTEKIAKLYAENVVSPGKLSALKPPEITSKPAEPVLQ